MLLKTASIILALCVWQIVSDAVGEELLLVSPIAILKKLSELIFDSAFLETLKFTFSRIALGFLLGLVVGTVLALLSGRFKTVEILLWPYMVTIKSIPVASFVVIALIWLSSRNLSSLISFLMVLPIIYTNVLEGIRSVDKKMLEMADVFRMTTRKRMRFIWLPSLKPFLLSGLKISLGLAWKSGVAAELIGIPEGSVGEELYYSKLYLDTESLFAWTVVIVVVSVLFEKLFLLLTKKLIERTERI